MLVRSPTLPCVGGALSPFGALLEDEAADLALVVLGPDDEHVGDRAVGNPGLGAGDGVAAVDLLRPRDHAARIRAEVRLGEAEAADPLAGGQLGQELLLLRLGAELVDRHHHQRALHAHHRAEARIDALDLARDQAVADIAHAGAAVLLGDDDAEHVERAHLAEDRRLGLLVPEHLQHARGQLLLAVGAGGVAGQPLFVGELPIEQQRIGPVEPGVGLRRAAVVVAIPPTIVSAAHALGSSEELPYERLGQAGAASPEPR